MLLMMMMNSRDIYTKEVDNYTAGHLLINFQWCSIVVAVVVVDEFRGINGRGGNGRGGGGSSGGEIGHWFCNRNNNRKFLGSNN